MEVDLKILSNTELNVLEAQIKAEKKARKEEYCKYHKNMLQVLIDDLVQCVNDLNEKNTHVELQFMNSDTNFFEKGVYLNDLIKKYDLLVSVTCE